MIHFRCCWIHLLLTLFLNGHFCSLFAAEPAEVLDSATVNGWINQLGSEQYAQREAAANQILSAGVATLPAVEAGTQHVDLEVRYRCEELRLKIIKADLRERLDAFASDTEGKLKHEISLWDRFSQAFGESAAARKMFIEMYRNEPELFMRCELERDTLNELLPARAMLLQQNLQLAKGTFAGVNFLLFAASEDSVKLNDQTLNIIISGCYQPFFQQEMNSNPEASAVTKKILARFVTKCEGWSAQQALNIATLYNLPEGLSLARKIAKAPLHAHMLTQAVPFIAKQGTRDDIPLLEGLLENRTVISNVQNNNVRYQTQVRDCALAAILSLLIQDGGGLEGTLLENKDLKAFGFARLEIVNGNGFTAHTANFADDKLRDEVFHKWAELKKQLDAKKKPAN
jgi:hypothetical protein